MARLAVALARAEEDGRGPRAVAALYGGADGNEAFQQGVFGGGRCLFLCLFFFVFSRHGAIVPAPQAQEGHKKEAATFVAARNRG